MEVDGTVTARCYFDRPSAPQREEDSEERGRILKDMKQLKELAVDYFHPELPVKSTDGCACGRNYFDRPSAPARVSLEEPEWSDMELTDAYHLKEIASDYLQPEKPVENTDLFACPLSKELEEYDCMEEPDEVLKEMQQLKKYAEFFLPPEKAVEVNPMKSYRNCFARPSAPEQESFEEAEAEERERILADAQELKKLAAPGHVDRAHHTYCEWVDRGYHHVVDHDHHYYWYSNADASQHQKPLDMDDQEEPHLEFKTTTHAVEPFKGGHAIDFVANDFHPTSPSCVRLLLTYDDQKIA